MVFKEVPIVAVSISLISWSNSCFWASCSSEFKAKDAKADADRPTLCGIQVKNAFDKLATLTACFCWSPALKIMKSWFDVSKEKQEKRILFC